MKRATIEIERDTLIIDGGRVAFEIIPEILYELAHPDPRRWYNFERVNDQIIVHIEIREPQRPVTDYSIPTEATNGNYVTERSPSLSGEGREAKNPLDEHRQDGQ
jgi:hypothetical protein